MFFNPIKASFFALFLVAITLLSACKKDKSADEVATCKLQSYAQSNDGNFVSKISFDYDNSGKISKIYYQGTQSSTAYTFTLRYVQNYCFVFNSVSGVEDTLQLYPNGAFRYFKGKNYETLSFLNSNNLVDSILLGKNLLTANTDVYTKLKFVYAANSLSKVEKYVNGSLIQQSEIAYTAEKNTSAFSTSIFSWASGDSQVLLENILFNLNNFYGNTFGDYLFQSVKETRFEPSSGNIISVTNITATYSKDIHGSVSNINLLFKGTNTNSAELALVYESCK
jgi:hypothetical protein